MTAYSYSAFHAAHIRRGEDYVKGCHYCPDEPPQEKEPVPLLDFPGSDRIRRNRERMALDARGRALLDAADALAMQPPMLRDQYVATLRLYAAEPWRLEAGGL